MRSAIVTGCSRGIGRAVTEMLLGEGWFVFGISRTAPELSGHDPDQFSWYPIDLASASPGSLADWLDVYADALIVCHGTQEPVGRLLETDAEAWERSVQTNLLGTYRVVKAALPALLQSDDARVLLFSGGGAFNPRPYFSAYAVAKAGIVSLAETLASELASTTVTVNCVSPGFVPTEIHKPTLIAGPWGAGATGFQQAAEGLANADGTQLSQVLACVRHLLSPDAHGLTGKTLAVGWDCWDQVIPETVEFLNASDIWTRTRVKAARVPWSQGVLA